MIRTLAALLAVSTLVTALPATAQPWRDEGRRGGGTAEQLERRIDFMRERGDLTWRDADTLHRQVDVVRRTEWEYGRNGLSNWERRDLDSRYGAIDSRLRYFAHADYGRSNWDHRRR